MVFPRRTLHSTRAIKKPFIPHHQAFFQRWVGIKSYTTHNSRNGSTSLKKKALAPLHVDHFKLAQALRTFLWHVEDSWFHNKAKQSSNRQLTTSFKGRRAL
ncbi:uncharacterized protein TM35_000311460 [Trypanosoma theileri]|uniref:Uncharacterized protein n=1 Tax=Trypanosoma theileri TaxID=67003 RepID=A0A1X0NP95_9TRYP|nr:uncharacterized protein TM35_000311460 [Trypanosoma theileri]ORC85960.1 hypothetical protein TM35_000311460 [Trypanosoma theileri]